MRSQVWTGCANVTTPADQITQAGFVHPPEPAYTARQEPSAARRAAVSGPAETRMRTLHQGEVGR
ncbi:hypothetical protein [Nocardia gipuzkoensis]